MLKWFHHDGCPEFSAQLGIIDCISKYFVMKKVAFLLISNISLHDTKVYWNNIFSVSSKGISLANNILNTVNYLWLWFYVH